MHYTIRANQDVLPHFFNPTFNASFSGLAGGTGQCLLSVWHGYSLCQVCVAAPGFSSAFSKTLHLTFVASPQRGPRGVVRPVSLGRCSSGAGVLAAARARAHQEPLSSHPQPARMASGSSACSVLPCFKPLPGEAAANALQPAVPAVPGPGGFPVPRAHPCKNMAFSPSEFCPAWFLRLWDSVPNRRDLVRASKSDVSWSRKVKSLVVPHLL